MDQAPDYFDFYLNHLMTEHDVRNERGRREVTQAMGLAVRKTQDAVLPIGAPNRRRWQWEPRRKQCGQNFNGFLNRKRDWATIPRADADRAACVRTTVAPPTQQEQWLLRLAFQIQRLEIGRPIVWIRAGWSIRRCAPFWKRRRKRGIRPKCW